MKNNINYIILISFCLFLFGSMHVSSQELCTGNTVPNGIVDITAESIFDFGGGGTGGSTMDFAAAILGTNEQKLAGTVDGGMGWFFSSLPPSSNPGAQSITYWTQMGNRSTEVQVTNHSSSLSVVLHIQLYLEDCTEFDFFDTFTPNDTHIYDLSNIVSNDGSGAVPFDFTGLEGFLTVTPVDTISSGSPLGFPNISVSTKITDSSNNFSYNLNGFSRAALTSGCSASTTDGVPILDGTSNCRLVRVPVQNFASVQLQRAKLKKSFSTLTNTIGQRGDLVIITFEDNYSSGYQVQPANADITPFIFNEDEVSFSCAPTVVSCFARFGVNSAISNSDTEYSMPVPIMGTEGDDVIEGTMGPDIIMGLGGNDIIRGLDGNDIIMGGPGNDQIFGGRGNDEIYGDNGNDFIRGGRGDDNIEGGNGKDDIRGNRGKDNLFGGNGKDSLRGNRGKDNLDGGNGKDILNGGRGNDNCINGETNISCE